MNMNRTERNRIKTDRAWSKLYQRLEEDRLIPAKEDKKLRMSPLWKWGAVAAALLAALVYAGVRYFSEVKTPVLYSLVVQQNKETSTLVTTLEDGSIVYLGGETLLQYPEHFLPEKREVKLQGNALFDVVGSRSRPFLIETQALVSTAAYGTPQRSATGFDLRRLNMLLAVLEKRVGFKLAQKDVFLNIAGGIRVTDPAIDLSVIASVLSSNVDTAIERNVCMAGEVGLSGEIRPVTRIAQRIAEAEKLGFSRFILPDANLKGLEGAKRHIELVPVHRVEEALRALFG